MKIEHFVAQSKDAGLRLTWSNLYGACVGTPGPPHRQTCDTRKGATGCDADPSTIRDEDFRYPNGRIEHPMLQHDLDEVLNLNVRHLVRARREALRRFTMHNKGWGKVHLERVLAELEARDGREQPEHAAMLASYVRRAVQRR
ncbi:MAG: hypothetical protein H6734_12540 [Alphaproteobacteria bacterium]|nr:hypothetical protein [Alphaproteobacteria bacterium]